MRRSAAPTGQPGCQLRAELGGRDGQHRGVERRHRGHRGERTLEACWRLRLVTVARVRAAHHRRRADAARDDRAALAARRAGARPAARGRRASASPASRRTATKATERRRSARSAIGPDALRDRPEPGRCTCAYHHLVCGDWWDEDATSPTYNQFRHVACGRAPPFARRERGAVAIDASPTASSRSWNTTHTPPCPGSARRSSCTTTTGSATNGCISLPRPESAAAPALAAAGRDDPHRTCINRFCTAYYAGCTPPPSSAAPAMPARRRSTACSRTPALEPIALGSDSLAGQPAQALDPRLERLPACVRAERRGCGERRRRPLPLPRQRRGGRVRAARRHDRRRPLRRAPARRSRPRAGLVRRRRPAPGATACPSSTRRRAR